MNPFHKARIKKILAEDKSGVPIHIDGQRMVIVRPSGLMLLDRVVVADVEPMTGDRIMVTMEALLPLPNGTGWPHLAARQCLELFRDGVEGDGG
jgi:hypothetical protein